MAPGLFLVAALKDFKDEKLKTEFNTSNQRAIAELRAYVAYLKEQKLPKANAPYALGLEKYVRMLACGEMIQIPPEQLLQIVELHVRQQNLSLDVAYCLKLDVSTFVQRLYDRLDSHCHLLSLPFDVAL